MKSLPGKWRSRSQLIAIAFIISVGAILRWLSPGRIALWRDEVQFARIATLPDVPSILGFLYHHESHPPLYYLVGHVSSLAFGTVEAPMGLLSLLASVFAIVLVFELGRRTFGFIPAIAAAAATALSASTAIYSVQLRPYGLISVLMLMSQFGLLTFWTNRTRAGLTLWAVTLVLIAYMHHLAILFVASQCLIVAGLQYRGPSLSRTELRTLLSYAALAGALMIPAFWWLVVQSTTAGYPALKPFSWSRPLGQLASLGLSLPFQVLLALLAALAALRSFARSPGEPGVYDGARPLVTTVAPAFFLFLTLASYRSQFLLPYVAVLVGPFTTILIAGHVASLLRSGHRWRALIWGELALGLFVMELLLSHGFMKTNTDLVARSLADRAAPSDLIVVMPGAAGASFNHYYDAENTQINYPYPHPMPFYPFDGDFLRVADPKALDAVLDSIESAFSGRRRVWLVTLSRWLHPAVPSPLVLSRDSFGGIGQADRSRANHVDRYLRRRYGRHLAELGADSTSRGQELLVALLYARDSAAPGPTLARRTGEE